MKELLEIIITSLSLIVPILLSVAYFTLLERKVLASIQRRRGPNRVGVLGLLQPFADGLKLFLKEIIVPSKSNRGLFIIAPMLTLFLSLISWAVVPLMRTVVVSDINLGIIYLLAVSSLAVYGIILAGWASNSKYAFLGALRSCAQMISMKFHLV
jgi:NADH-quinone oxidoreductase subunit H